MEWLDSKLKIGEKVKIVTMMGMTRFREYDGTIIKIHKNGNYKVLYDKFGYYGNFRPNGEKCGLTWKDYTTEHIERS